MAGQKMACVVKHFYPYFWHKFRFPIKYNTESECEELVKNLRDAVWVHRIVSFRHWHPFVDMNLIPMTSSTEMYVSCMFFMISTTIQSLHNRYEPFLTTCSLVTAVAAYVYDKGYHEFLDYSPTILLVFFEQFHEETFRKFKIWDHLVEYLISNNYSEAYDIVEEKTRGSPFSDVIFELDFVREINLKVRSKIPVSEHAAVYHQTQKVLKRFGTVETGTVGINQLAASMKRTLNKGMKELHDGSAKGLLHEGMKGSQDGIAKGLLHEGVKASQHDSGRELIKSRNKRSETAEVSKLNYKLLSELKQMLKDLKMQTVLESEDTISSEENDNLKIYPSKSEEPLRGVAKPTIANSKETTYMGEDENIEATSMRRWLQYAKTRTVDDEQSTSAMEETGEINVKQATDEFEHLLQDYSIRQLEAGNLMKDNSDALLYETGSAMEKIGEINLKQAAVEFEEQLLQDDSVRQLEAENLMEDNNSDAILYETGSAMEEIGEINLKQAAVEFEEQLLQDDSIRQLEAENLMKENSDAILRETEGSNQTTNRSKSSSKKKKKRSKSKQHKMTDSETNSHDPSMKDAARALLILLGKSENSLRNIYDLLEIPMDD